MVYDEKILTGMTQSHIETIPFGNVGVHKEVLKALGALRQAAHTAGFDLYLCSGFRSFESQLAIWNGKVLGVRPLLDENSQPLDVKKMVPEQIIFSILRWSALPGMSRHHWGTDFDIYDRARMPPHYELQLIPQEFQAGGYFAPLHDWLDREMEQFGFFRPYAADLGGVSPERWHLSYAPLAQRYWEDLTLEHIQRCFTHSSLALKKEVEALLPRIFERYFKKICLPR